MKNYEEIANSIFERRDQYVANQRKKRKSIVQITSVACSFVLVALLGVGVWQSGLIEQTPSAVIDNSGISLEQSGDHEQDRHSSAAPSINDPAITDNPSAAPSIDNPSHDNRRWTLEINKISDTVSAAKRFYDPALYYSEVWNTAKMAEYFGVDISAIGNGLRYSGSGKFTVYFANDGTMAGDTAVYRFNNDDVIIRVSKIGTPYDCLYALESDDKTVFKLRNLDTVPALVGASDNGLLYADFEYKGLNYRVTATNFSENQFAEIVKSTMELSTK